MAVASSRPARHAPAHGDGTDAPQQQDRYQQRYQQWQQMSPEERRKLENNLQRWDKLSPQERDSIRQRFKN
jgi:hypothetical protein